MTFEIVAQPKKSMRMRSGDEVVAFFDFTTADLKFRGAALVRRGDGTWDVWPPKLSEGHARCALVGVDFNSPAVPQGVVGPALQAYRALGGVA
jgi:hypothetical protein